MDFPKDKYLKVPACLNTLVVDTDTIVRGLQSAATSWRGTIILFLSDFAGAQWAGGWLGLDQVAPLTLNMKQQQQPAVPSTRHQSAVSSQYLAAP